MEFNEDPSKQTVNVRVTPQTAGCAMIQVSHCLYQVVIFCEFPLFSFMVKWCFFLNWEIYFDIATGKPKIQCHQATKGTKGEWQENFPRETKRSHHDEKRRSLQMEEAGDLR